MLSVNGTAVAEDGEMHREVYCGMHYRPYWFIYVVVV